MTRAEEAALKAFPDNEVLFFAEDADGNYHPVKTFGREVDGFIFGYEQAEKDLALTWEDIAKIDALILDINNEMAIDYSQEISRQKFYEEVLRRFNEAKMK